MVGPGGAGRRRFGTRVSHSGWRTDNVALPVLLAHLAGLGDVVSVTSIQCSSDMSMHMLGGKWIFPRWPRGGVKTYLLTELGGLNEIIRAKRLAWSLARRRYSMDVSFAMCSVPCIATEMIIFNFKNLCQIAFRKSKVLFKFRRLFWTLNCKTYLHFKSLEQHIVPSLFPKCLSQKRRKRCWNKGICIVPSSNHYSQEENIF